jgi:hypothetical protein
MLTPRCGMPRGVALAMLVLAAAATARAFVPIPPDEPIETSSRWSAIGHASTGGKGLQDGLSVFVAPGFAATLVTATLGTATAEDVADTEDAIRAAFAAWESPVLAFDVAFEAPAVRGRDVGAEIDLFVVAPDDPAFVGTGALFGITYFDAPFEPSRLLTNGATLGGFAISGADIFFKTDLIPVFVPLFPTREDKLHALQRLVMHEVGHALGLHHPNDFPELNLDTDTDPLDRMAIDPTAPFTGLLVGTPIDVDAVMSNFPTSIPGALVLTALRNDNRGGRDVLYPAPATVICPPIPRTHCRVAARGALAVKTVAGVRAKTRLAWTWSKGAATTLAELGDPLTTRITGLCIYSGAPAPLLALRVPPDPLLWKAKGATGFAYADRAASADGVKKVVLKSGAAGKASAAFAAGGVTMPVPALGALPAPMTVQLVNHDSVVCLESVFAADDLKTNTATKLKAKLEAP